MGLRITLGCLVTATLAACGGAAPGLAGGDVPLVAAAATPAPTGGELGLHPGERMTFEVALAGVPVAQAALAVGDIGDVDGRRAIVVSSSMTTADAFRWVKDVRDDLTSTIDCDSGLPLTILADVKFGDKLYHADGTFDASAVELVWDRRDGVTRHTHYDFGDVPAHDAHSAMAAMRTWEGEPGDARTVYIVGGRRIWQTQMTWVGRETIGTRLGNQPAVRLDGISVRVDPRLHAEAGKPPRTYSVWLSDDGDRAPLRVVASTELGDVTIELTGYERP